MTLSIRTFLLINLLLTVTLVTSLAIIGNLFLSEKDIQTNLDSQLIVNTLQIEAFFSDRTEHLDLNLIQKNLFNIYDRILKNNPQDHSNQNKDLYNIINHSIEFQIWDQHGDLILRSRKAPTTPFSHVKNGLSNTQLEGQKWRVYTLFNPTTKLTFMLAQHTNYRQQLENQLTQDAVFIMLIAYPFLGLLIWVIIGRGLASLQAVAAEVKHRDTEYLEPVDIDAIPSEIKPLIAELNSLFKRLKETFERNDRFTADAAHELRTPLAALSTQTQVALRAESTHDRNEALLKVLSSVNRCTHLVQQLLTLSRMNPEAGIQNPTKVVLVKQAQEIAAMLAPEAIAKDIDLELITPENHAAIIGNGTTINILIRNLIDNAIRYSQDNSTIQIIIEETTEHVILRVIDDGPGIPEELRQRVFERFYRMIGTKASGSGLGLGIVLQISKLHNADIQLLTPETGSGLEVRITFPAIPKDTTQDED